jgi:hypothetical protein
MTGERDPKAEHDERMVERVREEQKREDQRSAREDDREGLDEDQRDEDSPPA